MSSYSSCWVRSVERSTWLIELIQPVLTGWLGCRRYWWCSHFLNGNFRFQAAVSDGYWRLSRLRCFSAANVSLDCALSTAGFCIPWRTVRCSGGGDGRWTGKWTFPCWLLIYIALSLHHSLCFFSSFVNSQPKTTPLDSWLNSLWNIIGGRGGEIFTYTPIYCKSHKFPQIKKARRAEEAKEWLWQLTAMAVLTCSLVSGTHFVLCARTLSDMSVYQMNSQLMAASGVATGLSFGRLAGSDRPRPHRVINHFSQPHSTEPKYSSGTGQCIAAGTLASCT